MIIPISKQKCTAGQQEDEVTIKREKFDIAIRDIKQVACFLNGIEAFMEDDKRGFLIGENSTKLTNAIQWLNNLGE